MKAYRGKVQEVMALLATSPGKLAISMDIWTSSNHFSFMGVSTHFRDCNYKHRDLMIGFQILFGDHTGADQAHVLAQILKDHDIANKFHYFVGGNASDNDAKLLAGVNTACGLSLTSTRLIRSAGPIINLVIKAIIYGKGVSNFELELAAAAPRDQFDMFRKEGIVGKAHNFVTTVLIYPKRLEAFLAVQRDLAEDSADEEMSGDDRNDEGFARRAPLPYDFLTGTITEDEWEEVERLCNLLVSSYEMTQRLNGNNSLSSYGSLWKTFTNLQHLEDLLRGMIKQIASDPANSYLKKAVRLGLEKLTTYWKKIVIDPKPSF